MAGSNKIARISVCLNKEDPYQSQLINHIKKHTNDSAYLKALVIKDFEDKKKKAPVQQVKNLSMAQLNGLSL